jgi:hypothetical protein
MSIYRVLYTSQCSPEVNEEEVFKIIKHAQEKNTAQGITGMMLYVDDNFIQVLEGEKEQVKALYQKISMDQRHFAIKTVLEGFIPKRLFENWTMGLKILTKMDLEELKMLNNDPQFDLKKLLTNQQDITLEIMKHFYVNGKVDFKNFWGKDHDIDIPDA